MAKGGARVRSGPAPDPDALSRERDAGEWIELPPEGRKGPAPAWPLPEDVRAEATIKWLEAKAIELRDQWAEEEDGRKAAALARRQADAERAAVEARAALEMQEQMELELWDELWALPQAVMWERQHQNFEVALYCRRACEAQERGSKVNLGTLVRQMADSLGITTPGLQRNRWKIDRPGGAPAPREGGGGQKRRGSTRGRLTVVPDGGA